MILTPSLFRVVQRIPIEQGPGSDYTLQTPTSTKDGLFCTNITPEHLDSTVKRLLPDFLDVRDRNKRTGFRDIIRTRSYKKDDEPLLNLTGAMSRCSREKVLMYTKRELELPLWFSVHSMNKTGGRRKMFITRANAAGRLSSCSAPSQSLFKSLLWVEIAL